MRTSRLALVTLAVGVLVGGFALGRVVTAIQAEGSPSASGSPSLPAEPTVPQTFPIVDVDGVDFDDLPRYPDAVRTRYRVRDDAAGSAIRIEYLAVGSVEQVRSFYRQALVDHGWTVVDLQLAYGELRYLLKKGDDEGVIDIESRGDGVVEIDLEVVTPSSPSSGSPSPAPTASPRSTPAPPPTPPPDDDGGGDG